MTNIVRAGSFSDRVVMVFATQVFTSGVGIINGFLLAILLGPAGKGDYYLLALLPNTIMILSQLGLPQAFGFYGARGQTQGMVAKSLVLATSVSLVALTATLALLPFLREMLLHDLQSTLVIFGLSALPFMLNANFTNGLVLGRQAVRWYAAANVVATVASISLIAVMVGLLGLGVAGAIAAFVFSTIIKSVVLLVGAVRVSAVVPQPGSVAYRTLFRYGMPLYPGSITLFFSYRIDVYLLALLVPNPSVSLGYYSMAVGLTELVFFVSDSVSTLFFPHVAGSSREESDRHVPMVSRVTLLLTAIATIALFPVATVTIRLLVPAFLPSLPALYVLGPGVMALSVSKILSGYVSGLGRTGVTSVVNISAFALNVVLNLVLIPRFGIVGASAASLLSYSASSVAFTLIAASLAQAPMRDFWIPRLADLRFSIAIVSTLVRRVSRRFAIGG